MKQRFMLFLVLTVFVLTGCSLFGGDVEYINEWSFSRNEDTHDYSLMFGFTDKDGRGVASDATVDLRVESENGEVLYDDTLTVTEDDFANYSNALGREAYLCDIRIPETDIKKGTSQDGRAYIRVYNDFIEFDDIDFEVYGDLPVEKFQIKTEALPKNINMKNYMGGVGGTLQIDGIEYKTEEYGVGLEVIVSGTKLSQKGEFVSTSFDVQLIDEAGYVVDTGMVFLDNIAVGQKFKEDAYIVADPEPGKSYTLKVVPSKY